LAVYAIGDLQGCYDPFRRLLDKISFDPRNDHLWLTGDLVNRGPKSLKTLRYVKSLGSAAKVVLGNHDLHLLALGSGVRNSEPHYESLQKILAAPDRDELLDWLRQQPLARFDKKLNTLMVHAGVPPQWSLKKILRRAAEVEATLSGGKYAKLLRHMYGDRPRRWSGDLNGFARQRFIINAFTRTRMIYKDGRLNFTHNGPPEKARKGLLPWFEAEDPQWAGTRIVFGHWAALGLFVDEDLIGLDSGCVWGRTLSAVRLTKKARITQVSCPLTR
jgi:bis(5'-nucleosyl)-tetraphosphatase (symmetrical)